MSDLRSAFNVETPHPLLELPVRVADASMLAHVFDPRIQHEGLDETTRFRHVFEYPPVEGPIAPTLVTELAQSYQEGRAILGPDQVLDGYKDRPAILLHLLCEHGLGPMHGRRQVERSAALKLPIPEQRNRDQRGSGGGEMGGRKARPYGDLAPQRTANGKRPEHHRHEDRQAAPSHPAGQSDLRRDI